MERVRVWEKGDEDAMMEKEEREDAGRMEADDAPVKDAYEAMAARPLKHRALLAVVLHDRSAALCS